MQLESSAEDARNLFVKRMYALADSVTTGMQRQRHGRKGRAKYGYYSDDNLVKNAQRPVASNFHAFDACQVPFNDDGDNEIHGYKIDHYNENKLPGEVVIRK